MLRRVLFGVITVAFISLLFGISAGISYNFLNNSSFYVEHDFAEEREKKPKTYEFNIFMVGDLKYGRTVHSLLQAMSHFNPTFHFISPKELEMPIAYKLFLDNLGIPYYEHTELDEVINDADILYMTRVQRERFADPLEYEKVKNLYNLHNAPGGCKKARLPVCKNYAYRSGAL